MAADAPPDWSRSTIPDDPEPRWDRQEQRLRWVAYVLIGILVIGAALGLLGVRTSTVEASGGGLTLMVLHASITRPGLATPFSVTVMADDGTLPEEITVRLATHYLEMFDQNAVEPEPDRSTVDEESVRWTYEDLSDRGEMTVLLDARLEPAVQWGRRTTVGLEVEGEEVVETHLMTWVLP